MAVIISRLEREGQLLQVTNNSLDELLSAPRCRVPEHSTEHSKAKQLLNRLTGAPVHLTAAT